MTSSSWRHSACLIGFAGYFGWEEVWNINACIGHLVTIAHVYICIH